MEYLPEHDVPVHVHGEGGEVEENVVGRQALVHHVVPVDGHDGHTQEQVEEVRLVVRPARLPDPQSILLVELTLEAQQDPPGKRHHINVILHQPT